MNDLVYSSWKLEQDGETVCEMGSHTNSDRHTLQTTTCCIDEDKNIDVTCEDGDGVYGFDYSSSGGTFQDGYVKVGDTKVCDSFTGTEHTETITAAGDYFPCKEKG